MAAYLITFKPSSENQERGWPEEELARLARQVETEGRAREPWRFNKKHGVKVGERVFLLRQGRRGRAILGYGQVSGLPTASSRMTEVEFQALVPASSDSVYVTSSELDDVGEPKTWRTQSSGITLPDDVAAALEALVVGRTPIPNQESDLSNPDWTRDELIVALDFYLRHRPNPPAKDSTAIRSLSNVLQRLGDVLFQPSQRAASFRNTNGVYMKLMNFRRLDPEYIAAGKKGLTQGAKGEEEVWKQFAHDPSRCAAVAQAIINAVTDPESSLASLDEQHDGGTEEAEEGKLLTRIHLAKERNRELVKTKKARALKKYGKLLCEGCGFDFAVRYGIRGNGFIECHHTKPVIELADGHKTHIDDLALICANCHRIIHRTKPWLSIAALRALLVGH